MTDLKLFRIDGGRALELTSRSFALERNLQTLIEENMEVTFGVRYLAREYTNGKVHCGRIDSLGLDENGSPVIFEYKRTSNENVINQGLFYPDWLMDHKGEFQILVAPRRAAARIGIPPHTKSKNSVRASKENTLPIKRSIFQSVATTI